MHFKESISHLYSSSRISRRELRQLLKRIQNSIHNKTARIVSGATKLCSIQKLLSGLSWETLQERRSKHKLVIFYTIRNGLIPEYLSDLMPPLVSDTNPYNLRNSDNVQSIQARANIFFNSFFPSTIRAWNNLSEDIRNANTVNSFTSRLNRNRQVPPKNIGPRIEPILHARLRMECSSLNSHLYRKNIVPIPSCACGSFESPHHYLFQCPIYAYTGQLDIQKLNYLVLVITLMSYCMVKRLRPISKTKLYS